MIEILVSLTADIVGGGFFAWIGFPPLCFSRFQLLRRDILHFLIGGFRRNDLPLCPGNVHCLIANFPNQLRLFQPVLLFLFMIPGLSLLSELFSTTTPAAKTGTVVNLSQDLKVAFYAR